MLKFKKDSGKVINDLTSATDFFAYGDKFSSCSTFPGMFSIACSRQYLDKAFVAIAVHSMYVLCIDDYYRKRSTQTHILNLE